MRDMWLSKIKAFFTGLGLFFLGIIVVFLFFEAAFRIGGVIYRTMAHQRNLAALHQQGAIRILCLGESTTEMGGENSYPRQLERILNSRQEKIKFAVINGGVPGGNTKTIADHLAGNIKEFNPRIVILMMGINDVAVTSDGEPKSILAQKNNIPRWLIQSRLVRLVTSLWKARDEQSGSFRSMMFEQPIPTDKPDDHARMIFAVKLAANARYKEAIEIYSDLIMRYKKYGYWPNGWFYRQLGDIYQKQGDFNSLVMTLGVIVRDNPRDAWAVGKVQEVCRDKKNDDLIIKTLDKAAQNNNKDPAQYQLLGSCFEARGQAAAAEAAFKKAKQLRADAVNPLTRDNYRKVLNLLNEKGIEVIVMSYPLRSLSELENTLDGVAGADLAIQVDNEKIFKEALSHGRYEDYFIDRFAGDFGHCTPKGNQLLAQNVADAILKAHK